MFPASVTEILAGAIRASDKKVMILKAEDLGSELTDNLVHKAVFGNNEEKAAARWVIWEAAQVLF